MERPAALQCANIQSNARSSQVILHNLPRASDTFPTLVTRRLRLRRFEPHDAADLHACVGDKGAMRIWNFPASKTMAETEKALVWLSKTTSLYDHLAWAICKEIKRSMHWHGQLSPQRRPPQTPSIGLHRCAEAPEMRLRDRGRAGGPRLLCRRTPRP